MAWSFYDQNGKVLQGVLAVSIGTTEIADDAVTYAKLQNLATADRVLGSTSTGLIGEVQVVADMVATDAILAPFKITLVTPAVPPLSI